MLAKFYYILLCTLPLFLPCSVATAAEPAPPSVRDFQYIYTLKGDSEAGLYRISLPFEVYRQSQQSGLKDLRIFDIQGQAMPFSISEIPQLVTDKQQHYPAYQVRVAQQGGSLNLLGGGASAAQKPAAPTSDAIGSTIRREADALLFDFGKENHGLTDFRLIPKANAPTGRSSVGTVLSAELFTGSDMVNWRSAGLRTFGHISAEGQQVELLSLSLATKDSYVLLVPVEGTSFFAVQGVEATAQTRAQDSYREYYTKGTWDAEAEGYVYTVPPSLPVRTLSLELPGSTWLAHMDILTRGPKMQRGKNKQRATTAENLTWDFRATHRFYSVVADDRVQTGKALDFPPSWLRVAAKPNVLLRPAGQRPAQAPELHIAYDRQELYFLAAGQGPFRLAVGCALPLTGGADKSVTTALTQQEAGTLHLGAMQDRVVSSDTGADQRLFIWGALLLGALCMGGIALHMLRTRPRQED